MSLFKQLLIAICLFLVVAFSGSFMVSLEGSRTQYVNQLRSHAQDAATALALSLTPNIDDPAMVELLVSSIFDSGYYASIRVVDLATDKTIVERSGIPDNNGVPNWFVKLIGLEPAGGDALVSRGWEQAARVSGQPSDVRPGQALAKRPGQPGLVAGVRRGQRGARWAAAAPAIEAVGLYGQAIPRHCPPRVPQPA